VVGTLQWHRTAGELLPLAFVPTLAVTLGIQETLIAGGVLVVLAAAGQHRYCPVDDRARAVALAPGGRP